MDYFDQVIKHQVDLIRVEAYETKRIQRILAEADRKVAAVLAGKAKLPNPQTRAFATLSARLTKIRTDAIDDVQRILTKQLKDLVDVERTFELRALKTELDEVIDVDLRALRKRALQTPFTTTPGQMASLDDWFVSFRAADLKRLSAALEAAAYTKGNASELIVGTRSQRYKNGVLRKTHYNAEALVRSSFNHVSNIVRTQLWEANPIRVVRWTAILDRKLCPICLSHHGKYAALGGGKLPTRFSNNSLTPSGLRPPLHANCRCVLLPVFDLLGTADLPDADEWLKAQSVDEQNALLGVGKAQLFRKGTIDATALTAQTGRLLSLAELSGTQAV